MSFLRFTKREQNPDKKTQEWRVNNIATWLGNVSWYAPWRRYTYAPAGPQVLDASCMRELADFCETETKAQQEKRKAEKSLELQAQA